MAKPDRDYVQLQELLKLLSQDLESSIMIESIYSFLYGDQHPPRPIKPIVASEWSSHALSRVALLVAEIVARYVRFFHEPRDLPVTHYWKQKQVALLLDEKFSSLLWEVIKRSEKGTPHVGPHDFLDKPILFLKQEAREGHFSNLRKTSKFAEIEKRFVDKLKTSGAKLEVLAEEDFHSL